MLRGCLWFVSLQKPWLLRSRSFSHEEIENLLANDHQELIGDFSKVGLWGCCRPGGPAPFPLKQRSCQQSPAPVQEPKPSCGGLCLGTRELEAVTFQPADPVAHEEPDRCSSSASTMPWLTQGSRPQGWGEQVTACALGGLPGVDLDAAHPLSSRLTSCRQWKGSTRT